MRVGFGSEFIVAATKVPHERVAAHDLRSQVSIQYTHGPSAIRAPTVDGDARPRPADCESGLRPAAVAYVLPRQPSRRPQELPAASAI